MKTYLNTVTAYNTLIPCVTLEAKGSTVTVNGKKTIRQSFDNGVIKMYPISYILTRRGTRQALTHYKQRDTSAWRPTIEEVEKMCEYLKGKGNASLVLVYCTKTFGTVDLRHWVLSLVRLTINASADFTRDANGNIAHNENATITIK